MFIKTIRLLAPFTLPVVNPAIPKNITKVAIIGAGIMGSGIAQACALANHRILVYDITPEFHMVSKYKISKSLEKHIPNIVENVEDTKKRAKEVMENITYTTDLQSAFDNTELVIEAISENLAAKKRLFEQMEQYADPITIFGSTSQTIQITEIAQDSPRKDRSLGIHFFFPVYKTQKVELVKLVETSDRTFNQVKDWVESLGKTALLVPSRSCE